MSYCYHILIFSYCRSDSSSGRRSPHSNDNNKKSNGNLRHGTSSNRKIMLVNSFIYTFLFTLNI